MVDKVLTKDNQLSQPGGQGGRAGGCLSYCQRAEIGARQFETATFSTSPRCGHVSLFGGSYELGKEYAVKNFLKLLKDKSGASAAEYALILAIVGSAIAVAALGLGNAVGNRMNAAASCINGGTSAACPAAAAT